MKTVQVNGSSAVAKRGHSGEAVTQIEVTRIHHYARNPRRQENPEYDRIKSSIRAEGLDQLLVITQAPGSEDYVLQAGGNTRLRILKELYEETGEDRFQRVNCVFKPWAQESSVLFAHLRENELRGSLSFIDKALAVVEVKRLLEDEQGIEELSQRQLATLFTERGFGLSHSMISRMAYAVNTLWPNMPNALNAGMGRPQVEKIRSLGRAARHIWLRRKLGDDALFDMIFAELCRRYDEPEWDIQPLRAALENEIAEEAEQSLQAIRLEMAACLAGKAFVEVASQPAGSERSDPHTSTPEPSADPAAGVSIKPIPSTTDSNPETGAELFGEKRPLETFPEDPETLQPSTVSMGNIGGDVASLRDQVWTLASRLAERNGLGELMCALPDQGMGFILRDVPDSELSVILDQEMLGQVSTLWWQLAACSEMTVAPVDLLVKYLNEDAVLRQALEAQDAGLLFSSVWTLDPGHTGHQLWQQLNDKDWQDLLGLMDSYRALKRLAKDTGVMLWAPVGEPC